MMAIHPTSRSSYRDNADARGQRREAVLRAYQRSRQPLTDRQVMEILGFADPNAVRPIITVLVQWGALREVGNTICPVTGRSVRLVAVVGRRTKQRTLFSLRRAPKKRRYKDATN